MGLPLILSESIDHNKAFEFTQGVAMAMDIAKVTRENSWHGGRFKHGCIALMVGVAASPFARQGGGRVKSGLV